MTDAHATNVANWITEKEIQGAVPIWCSQLANYGGRPGLNVSVWVNGNITLDGIIREQDAAVAIESLQRAAAIAQAQLSHAEDNARLPHPGDKEDDE